MPEKTSIIFFNSTRFWGGGEKWHFDMAEALYAAGYKITVFAHPKSELYKKISGLKIPSQTIRISNLSFLNPLKINKIKKLFSEVRANTIILNAPSDLKTAGIAAHKAGIKNIIYRRGSAIPVKNSFLNRYLFSKIITQIITNSHETKKTILKYNAQLFPQQQIAVIYNGVDTTSFPTVYEQVEKTRLVLASVGRLTFQKGHDYLIDIAHRLKTKGIDFQLKIAGTGPLEQELKDKIKKFSLEPFVSFEGFVKDVPYFLQSVDMLVHPSRWEGFGYAIVEAAAMKIPSIAFNISSNQEIIEDGETGILIPAFQTQKFAEAIIGLYHDKSKIQEMGIKAQRKVYKQFTLEKSINDLRLLLDQLT